jgi:hypothetical protein
MLAGGPEDHYIRAPALLVLVLGPLMGLVYVTVLPLVGLAVLVPFLAGKLHGAIFPGAAGMAGAEAGAGEPGAPCRRGPLNGEFWPDGVDGKSGSGRLIDIASEIASRRWDR